MADYDESEHLLPKSDCPGLSYTDLLNLDTRPVPQFLKEESQEDLGTDPISTERYTSAEFAKLENEKMWPNVWQFVAREEELPNPGDLVVFENAGRSYIIVRQLDGGVRAFHNVCLHRGRKLRTESGSAEHLQCPFHGFTWNNDGSLKEVPCSWDFEHLEPKELSLPELRLERWQGFIMTTENADIPDFKTWLGPVAEHYERWRLDECYTAMWVAKVIPANWKATAEAFMEAFHSVVTHPQILPYTGDANTRYDIYGDHANRAITPAGVLSPHIAHLHDQDFILDELLTTHGRRTGATKDSIVSIAEKIDDGDPVKARKIIAESNRRSYAEDSGYDFTDMSDSEMIDNFTYNVFPNFAPWGGFIPNLLYRWRTGKDADHCMMEIRVLKRAPQGEPMPESVPMTLVPEGEMFSSVAHIMGEGLARVFDQDLMNLPYVQEGMKASANKEIQLGRYQESRIRQFHRTLDKYLDKEW